MSYCEKNGLNPSEVNVYLAPFMSIAGDHAHNDLWGLEAMAEDDDVSNVEINTNEYSWRERLEKLGSKWTEHSKATRQIKPEPIMVLKTDVI